MLWFPATIYLRAPRRCSRPRRRRCVRRARLGKPTTRLVVGFPPRGSGDLFARIIAQPFAEQLDRNVIVDDKPGAGGMTPAQRFGDAEPVARSEAARGAKRHSSRRHRGRGGSGEAALGACDDLVALELNPLRARGGTVEALDALFDWREDAGVTGADPVM